MSKMGSNGPGLVVGAGAFLALALLVAAAITLGRQWGREAALGEAAALGRTVTPRGDLAADEKATIELFRAVAPSVVHITTMTTHVNYFTRNVSRIPEGTGSGIVWDRVGDIVTNFHVIREADGAAVALSDGSTWEARIVGYVPDVDLAVLRIDAPAAKLSPITLGTSEDLQVGQKALAIGNPFGLDHTLTTGVISALGREIESVTRRPIHSVIQTDAAVNPGNSGGPLLDSAGRLIGINTAIYSPAGVSAGIGFAIPVDTVRRVVPQVIQRGRASRPTLGVQTAEDPLARRLGVSHGVLVVEVVPGSGAERAGVLPTRRGTRGRLVLGDVIVAVEGKAVDRNSELLALVEGHAVGDKVKLGILRGGQRLELTVALGEAD